MAEELNPNVELTGADAAEFETSREEGEFGAQDYALPQLSYVATKTDKTTVDALADVLVVALEGKAKGSLAVRNTGSNSITWEVLGSFDGGKTFPVTVFAGGALANSAAAPAVSNWAATGAAGVAFSVYSHLKVRARSTTAATPSTVSAQGAFSTA